MSDLSTAVQGLGTQPVKTQESLPQASLGLRARLPLSSVPFPDYGIAIFHLTPHISALEFIVSFHVFPRLSLFASDFRLLSAEVTDMRLHAELTCLSLDQK